MKPEPIADRLRNEVDPEGTLMELQKLVHCYRASSPDDKKIVWSALNKYAKSSDRLA